MIYAMMRVARECPNLFLFNVGAWGILAMLASDTAAIVAIDLQPQQAVEEMLYRGPAPVPPPPLPPSPTPLEMWRDAAFGPAGLAVQGLVVFCGCCLMLFAIGRGFQLRRISRRRLRGQNTSCSPVTP